MRLRAASWPWLLAHELRLGWRGLGGASTIAVAVLAVLWILFHPPAWFVMERLSLTALERTGLPIAGFVCWFVVTLMLSGAILLALNALYDRGDLDLLVSSPLPATVIFAVRGVGVALISAAFPAALLVPFVNMGIARGQWGLLGAYPVLVSVGLGVSGLAFALTLLLVRWLGARRARTVTQVLSALVGAMLFLAVQLPNVLPDEGRAALAARAAEWGVLEWLGADSILWWPVRALFGDPLPLLATVTVGVGLFVVVIRATSNAFLSGTQEAVAVAVAVPARDSGAEIRFQAGLAANVVRKELRLILRDPNLIAQVLLQALYLLPLLFVMARNRDLALILAPAIIALGAQMAGNLAWITICGEEAPELLGSAPVDRERVRWLKASAALVPAFSLTLPFAVFYLFRSPALAAIFASFLALALTAAAMTQIWGGKPAPRRDLRARQRQNVLLNLVELVSTLGFAGACYLAMTGSWWVFAPIAAGVLAPSLAWARRHRADV